MTSHDKKRVLESDIKALREEFLETREKQLGAKSMEEWTELERRASGILVTISSKQQAIHLLFPDHQLRESLATLF
ncbi:hypothetical protein [Pontibacter kalidii]|uniref:hypothetical protein n=1 Tax=Pontibacter kalidii TaxID=2592049 RepID=UPI00224F48CF|nr:hypothetical protein [Pontibacter kalidii]